MSVYELAKGYYPRLWGRERIEALAAAGRLTREQADEITGEEITDEDGGEAVQADVKIVPTET